MERTNRRALIVQTAATLFLERGYPGTSVRQIADAAGMTEAALYYHFRQGKRELFQAAMDVIAPDFKAVLEDCEQAETLTEFVQRFAQGTLPHLDAGGVRMRWLITQMQILNADERQIVFDRVHSFQQGIANRLERFVVDAKRANQIAWTMLISAFGYSYLFGALQMDGSLFTAFELVELLLPALERPTKNT
ncbi:MAG: helix-turn-helix domain-containing protein [Anaerolineae bacterium]